MFESLTFSLRASGPGVHRYLASGALHALLGAAAVAATDSAGAARPVRSLESPIPIFSPPAPKASRPEVLQSSGALPAPPALPQAFAAPRIAAPVMGPHTPGVGELLVRGSGPEAAATPTLGLGDERDWSEPLEMEAVDEPVEVISQPTPRFPPALAGAGIGGRVELEYVVDTTGRAEPGSLRSLASAHPAFEAAARVSVVAARYRPARVRGRVVRQLVRQTLSFRPAP